jgi:hypothetical protein
MGRDIFSNSRHAFDSEEVERKITNNIKENGQ